MIISPVNTGAIDLVMSDEDHLVYYNNKPLLTPGGNKVKDENQRMLRQLIIESCLMNMITDEKICFFALQSVCTDFLGSGRDPFLENFDELCKIDPFLQLRQGSLTAGGISQGSFLQSLPEKDPVLFNMMFWGISGALEAFSLFSLEFRETINKGKKIIDWNGFLKNVYSDFPSYQKAVVNLLSYTHRSAVILPILLSCRYISGREYVNGLSVIHLRLTDTFSVSPFAVPRSRTGASDFLEGVPHLLDDACIALGFLDSCKSTRLKSLAGIIGRGEGNDLEFKSTLRWDLKAGKTNQQVERACFSKATRL